MELTFRVSRDTVGPASSAALVCEALSGDGVSYARIVRELSGASHLTEPAYLATGVRSALSRIGPELPEPLMGAATEVVLALGGGEAEVLTELGIEVDVAKDPHARVDETLQARTGISVGTPIRIGS